MVKAKEVKGLSTKERALFLLTRKEKSKEYIKQKIFPNIINKTRAYSDLKRNLARKLTYYLIESDVLNRSKKNEIKLKKDLILFLVLRAKNKNSAIKLGKAIVDKSLKLEFWDIYWTASHYLSVYFLETKRFKESRIYLLKCKDAQKKLNAISEITETYLKTNSGKYTLSEATPVNYRSGFFYYINNAYYYEYNKEYQKSYESCLEGLKYFESKNYNTEIAKKFIKFQIIPNSIILNKKPQDIINESFNLEQNGTNNYYLLVAYQSLLYVRQKKYKRAFDYINSFVVKNEYRLKQLRLIQGWASLFINSKEARRIYNEVTPKGDLEFCALELMNIFYIIKRKNYDRLIQEKENIRNFAQRHTNNSKRLKMMFSIVDLIIKTGFKKEIYNVELVKKIKELKGTKVENINIEVVDFELLVSHFIE